MLDNMVYKYFKDIIQEEDFMQASQYLSIEDKMILATFLSKIVVHLTEGERENILARHEMFTH